ncbi:MAG: nuclear transport factor 2 family protein [Thermaerobacterales bacterium]
MDSKLLVQLAETYYDLIDKGDLENLLALFREDVIYERGAIGRISGKQALRRFFTEERVISEGRHTLESAVVEGSVIAIQGRFEGILKSGEAVRVRFADFFRVEDGKIRRRDSYFMDRFL